MVHYSAFMLALGISRKFLPFYQHIISSRKLSIDSKRLQSAYNRSNKALEIIETCRQACGGQGYSSYAGLASMFQDFAVQCTWEGDNTVMTLQLGRYLISCARDRLQKNKKLPAGVAYLNALPEVLKRRAPANADISDPKIIAEAMDVTCANAVAFAAQEFQRLVQSGKTEEEAFESSCKL